MSSPRSIFSLLALALSRALFDEDVKMLIFLSSSSSSSLPLSLHFAVAAIQMADN
jgi:hypothetical protein